MFQPCLLHLNKKFFVREMQYFRIAVNRWQWFYIPGEPKLHKFSSEINKIKITCLLFFNLYLQIMLRHKKACGACNNNEKTDCSSKNNCL